jgi:predicted metal-binding protein
VDAEVDERSATPKDTACLDEGLGWLVKICVRQERNDRVELLVPEGQCVSICTDELCDVAVSGARTLKLIFRYVDPDNRPT